MVDFSFWYLRAPCGIPALRSDYSVQLVDFCVRAHRIARMNTRHSTTVSFLKTTQHDDHADTNGRRKPKLTNSPKFVNYIYFLLRQKTDYISNLKMKLASTIVVAAIAGSSAFAPRAFTAQPKGKCFEWRI